ncbi:MAG: Spy/CpxP family protein refolding chaperone [Bryobacteraceae bacterium]
MNLRKKLYSVCAVGLLATGMLFAAKDHASGPQRRLDFLASRLNLTDAQKASAQTLFSQSQEAAKPIRQQLRQSHQALSAAIKAGKSDAELTQLAEQQSALAGQLTAIRAKAFSRLYTQLTDEQKQKAEGMHQRMSHRFGHRAGGAQ